MIREMARGFCNPINPFNHAGKHALIKESKRG